MDKKSRTIRKLLKFKVKIEVRENKNGCNLKPGDQIINKVKDSNI